MRRGTAYFSLSFVKIFSKNLRAFISKFVEPISMKLPLFVCLSIVSTQKNFQENLINKFFKKTEFVKKMWFSRFFWENFTFHKIYELKIFENFSEQIPSRVECFYKFIWNSIPQFFCTSHRLRQCFWKPFSQTEVKFYSSCCAKFFHFVKSVPQHAGIIPTNFCLISFIFHRKRAFSSKSKRFENPY